MSTQQDTDDDRSITLEQQAKFAVGDDSSDPDEVVEVPDEPVATTVSDFGVEVDPHDPETCIDEPEASGLTADDRPTDDQSIGPSTQESLFADVAEGQAALDGDDAHNQPMFETDDTDDADAESVSDEATDTDDEQADAEAEADEQSDDSADECDETSDDEATETTDDKTDEEAEVDLLDSGIIDEAGVAHRTLREALTDTEYDLRLTSIPGIGDETAEQLRGVKCPDTAILAVAWTSDIYHAHVADALSELPANHRERAITDIEALYDEVLAELVEPEANWADDPTPSPVPDADADTESDADDPLAA